MPDLAGSPAFAELSPKLSWYLRHEALFLSWALMEVALFAPLALVFLPWARFWPPGLFAIWYLLQLLAAFNLTRLMSLLRLPVERQRAVTAIALLIAVLVNLRFLLYETASAFDVRWLGLFFGHIGRFDNPLWLRDMAVFGLVVVGWWRGIGLSGRRIDIGELGLRFRLSVFLVAPVVITLASLQLPGPITPFVLLFFLASLTAVILTRLEQLNLDSDSPANPIRPLTLLAFGLTALAAVTITTVVTGLLSATPLEELSGGLSPLFTALVFLLVAALSVIIQISLPFLNLVGLLFGWLFDLVGQGFSEIAQALDLPEPPPELLEAPADLTDGAAASSVLSGQLIGLLTMVAIVLVVSLALSRIFVIRRRQAGEEAQTVSPGLASPGAGLAAMANRLLDELPFLRRRRAAATVRRIYQAMCATAAGQGHGRLPEETPFEYLQTLSQAWPNNDLETRRITEAYTRVRYGEIPEDEDELASIRQAWQRLQEVEAIVHQDEPQAFHSQRRQ